MSPSQDDKKRIRAGGRYNFDQLSSSILSSDWRIPDGANTLDAHSDDGLRSDANSYAKSPQQKHAPAPMRQRAAPAKHPLLPKKPSGWGPTVVFGILIGIASFGFAFDFASDGKLKHFFGFGAPQAEIRVAENSSDMKQLPIPEPQTIARKSEPAEAVSAPPAASQPPVAPPIVQSELPVPEAPRPVAVEQTPVVTAPLAAKSEAAVLPIPEPEKTLQPAPSISQKQAETPAATAPAVEPPKPPAAPDVVIAPPRPVAQDADPAVQAAPAPAPSVETATPEVVPAPVSTPQQTTAPAPVVNQSVQQGNVIRDCADCPQLVAVPAGSFVKADEANPGTPAKTTTVDHDFAIGRYEITFDDWKKCVVERGCLALPDDGGWGRDRRPLIFVSYEDISTQYLPWLSKLTGHTYRLPTKDEWQFAAAGGAGTVPGKGQSGALSECFNASGAAAPDCATAFTGTAPVGSFPPSTLGVYDMKGNVWEWSADCWQPFSYAPKTGDTSCDMRLVLGGAWSTARSEIGQQTVGWEKVNKRTNSIGFRIVRSLP